MYLRKKTITSTKSYLKEIEKLKAEIATADAIIIGAGAGLSASAGLSYDGERFEKYFSDFKQKYGISDMYLGGFYPYKTAEEYWAWWSRMIWCNRYETVAQKTYCDLLKLVKDKDYFVITTNVDHQFQKAGFDKSRLFYTQGDYGLFQCINCCQNKTFDNEAQIKAMVGEQQNMKIPADLIPRCPLCGEPMVMNLRCDDNFVEDSGWHNAKCRYENFLQSHKDMHILFLELGVGMNTPSIIKIPFWQMVEKNKNATYACINKDDFLYPDKIKSRSILVNWDIKDIIEKLSLCTQ